MNRQFPTGRTLRLAPLRTSLAALGLASLLAAPSSGQQFGSVQNVHPRSEAADGPPAAIDVDGDGDLDLLSTSYSAYAFYSHSLEWTEQLELNSGVFGPQKRLLAPSMESSSLHVADLDGNGHGDLLVRTGWPFSYSVIWNEGSGLQSMPVVIGSPVTFTKPTSADIDGDGDLDILMPATNSSSLPQNLTWMENLGNRTFAPQVFFSPVDDEPWEIFPRDVDGDGDVDLIAAGYDRVLRWFRQDPAGFTPLVILSQLPNFDFPKVLAIDDLDLDGDLDILVTQGSRLITVKFDAPTATYMASQPGAELTYARTTMDVDGDGLLDVLCARVGDPLSFRRGLGDTTFGVVESLAPSTAVMQPFLLKADVNGDGLLDLVSMSPVGASWLRGGLGSSGLVLEDEPTSFQRVIGDVTAAVALALDSDDSLDVVVGQSGGGLFQARGTGFGSFAEIAPFPTGFAGGVRWLRAEDMDGDGQSDLLMTTQGGLVQYQLLAGNGTAAAPVPVLQLGPGAGPAPQFLDFDGDGDLDGVGAVAGTATVGIWTQAQNGTFGPPTTLFSAPLPILNTAVGDVNGDGHLDLVVALQLNGSRSRVRWYAGDTSGTFASGQLIANEPELIVQLRAVDLTGDGVADVSWGRPIDGVMFATSFDMGSASFSAPTVVPNVGYGDKLVIADLDGDGIPDLLSGGGVLPLAFARGLGNLTYATQELLGSPQGRPVVAMTADLDQDGDLDLLTQPSFGSQLSWFPNQRVGTPTAAFCAPAKLNSSHQRAELSSTGSRLVAEGNLTLRATRLPPSVPTLFLVSQTQASVPGAGGSQGVLCLGGEIGRFVGPGQLQVATLDGAAELAIDLTALPQPTGSMAAMIGESWSFQAWFRDAVAGQATSNFTSGAVVVFE